MLQESQTAAHEECLQVFGAVEMELGEAFVDRRAPAVVRGPFNAALHSMSLVARQEAMAAAQQICEPMEEFTVLFHGRQPTDLGRTQTDCGGLYEAHVSFVNAASRSLDPSQEQLIRALSGSSAWHGLESAWAPGTGQRDRALSLRLCSENLSPAPVMALFELGSVSDLVNPAVKVLRRRKCPGHRGRLLIARVRVLSWHY
ncbi:hypothetical protein [Streptomyces sp. NPDC003710]